MAFSVPPAGTVLPARVPPWTARLRLLALGTGLLAARFAGLLPAQAQIDPDDTGAGTKLGLAQEHNSGQVGTVTLYRRGPAATLVVVALASEPPLRAERAAVERGPSCAAGAAERSAPAAFALAPVLNGASRTLVPAPAAKLLSGNYRVAVYFSRQPRARRSSCGQLRR